MKVTYLKPTEINIVYVDVVVPVDSYDIQEEAIPADCHGLCDGQLRLRFNLDTKRVENWIGGKVSIHLKPRDEGIYRLLDGDGNLVNERNWYVPSFVPNNGSDYFACNIAEDGTVTEYNGDKWRPDDDEISEWLNKEED